MHRWMRPLGDLLVGRSRFHKTLVASVVTIGITGSVMLAMGFDPVLRTLPPDVGAEFQGLPVMPAKPVAPPARAAASAPLATERQPVSVASEPARVKVTAAPMSVPIPIARPARPDDVVIPRARPTRTAELAAQGSPRADGHRQSRSQVARNARNERRRYAALSRRSGANAYALISEARRHIGTNPTRRARLWCARFMNYVLRRSGYRGTGSDMAMSFAHYGRRVSGPRVGAIAVLRRRGGGHVGIVTAVPGRERIKLISGNDGRRVRERIRSTRAVIAYVMPRR